MPRQSKTVIKKRKRYNPWGPNHCVVVAKKYEEVPGAVPYLVSDGIDYHIVTKIGSRYHDKLGSRTKAEISREIRRTWGIRVTPLFKRISWGTLHDMRYKETCLELKAEIRKKMRIHQPTR